MTSCWRGVKNWCSIFSSSWGWKLPFTTIFKNICINILYQEIWHMAVWNISCISNQLEINMFSCVSYSRNRIYNLHKFQVAAFHHFFMEENIFMQFTVTIKGVLYVFQGCWTSEVVICYLMLVLIRPSNTPHRVDWKKWKIGCHNRLSALIPILIS